MDTLPPWHRKRLLALLPAVVVVLVGLLLWLIDSPVQQALRHDQFDQFQRWKPRPAPAQPVRIVDIDEASLLRLGPWPWPRNRMADLLDRLATAGAAAVVFDNVFADPQPDGDASFVRSLQQSPAVLGFALLRGAASAPSPSAALSPQDVHVVWLGEAQTDWLHRFDGVVTSLPLLQAAAGGSGAISWVPDGDGVVRRVPLALRLGDMPVPSLVSETLRVASAAAHVELKSAGANSGLAEVRIGALTLPTTPQGEMWLHYSRPIATRSLPAWQVLANPLPPGQLSGQIVLVGSSAPGLADLRPSPLGLLPGVEIQAQALDQILDPAVDSALSGHLLHRPGWVRALEALLLVVGGLLVGVLALRQRAWQAAAAGLGVLAALLLGAWWAFVARGLLLDALSPALVWVLAYLVCSAYRHLRNKPGQHWVQQAFAGLVSPNRVAWLLAHPKAVELGGRRQVCSFVFTDLAGFSSLLETLDPTQAVQLLQNYQAQMLAIAFRHEATLDRVVGGAIAVMFSAPVKQADHRARALACALEMDTFACSFAAQQQGMALGKTRIGVHSGEVTVGNFGGSAAFDYRALGDAVATCAQLEAANQQLGTRLCVSIAIAAGNPKATLRPVGSLMLPGKEQALEVFEPVTTQDSAQGSQRAPLPEYLAAYQAMQKQDPQAVALFSQLAADWPQDPLVRLYLHRLVAGEQGDRVVLHP